jgi:hypothetical protein
MERKTVVGTGGELLVHQLVAQGVDYVFTNTGSAEAGFFNGLLAVPGVQPILLLMEPLVLSAADGYGKIADKPAFVNVHLAAGTRQGSGQLQNAYFDGTPMSSPRPCAILALLVITSRWAQAAAFHRWALWKTLPSAAGKYGMPAVCRPSPGALSRKP